MADQVEDNAREVLHLHIGSAGIEIGKHCWQLYCLEHNLDVDGCTSSEQNPPQCFSSESIADNKKKFRPRALFINFDSNEMDSIKTSNLTNLFDHNQFLLATDFPDSIFDRIRKQIEICDHFQGFMISHSTSGKCSDLTSTILNNLTSEYSNKTILTNSIFGSSVNICHTSNLFKTAHAIIPIENKAMFNLCKHRLNIETPTYLNINRLIAHSWSSITCSMRFDGSILSNLNEFEKTLIPYPTLKLISTYLSPLIPFSSSENIDFKSPSVYDMCIPSFFQSNNSFIQQTTSYKMVLTVSLMSRGENIVPKEIGQKLICDMKKLIRFSDHATTGYRCGINYHRPYIFNDRSDIALTDKQVSMLMNETESSKYLYESILNQYDKCSNEQIEIIEAQNYLQELKANCEEFEKEIVNDN
jgi:tubulin alpha